MGDGRKSSVARAGSFGERVVQDQVQKVSRNWNMWGFVDYVKVFLFVLKTMGNHQRVSSRAMTWSDWCREKLTGFCQYQEPEPVLTLSHRVMSIFCSYPLRLLHLSKEHASVVHSPPQAPICLCLFGH